MNGEKISKPDLRDEAFVIRRERSVLASHWKNPEQVSADMLTNAR